MRLDVLIAASFWVEYRSEITAVATVVGAILLARFVDRALAKRGGGVTTAIVGGELSPVADTRLRLVRRLVFLLIILIGVALALSQFAAIRRVATGVLASSALLGLVVGFAARQTLANVVAGIMLAITQPIRVGDLITFDEETGVVEDVRLTYTYVRCDDGRRLVIPNERLAENTVENHTVVDPRVQVEVSIWLPPGADVARALELMAAEPDVEVQAAEVDKEGIRLSATTWAPSASQRGPLAADLRAKYLQRLREEGLSSEVAP